ncbi:MAG: FHA domain-containing protein [Actinomycetota bacterium]|nr:FHA domain-containing protein [Actinomycetota bacterium]
MASYLEVWRPEGAQLVALESDRVTVGNHPSADVEIASDRSVSRLHAVLERYPTGWCIRDMASANGTFVNGQRLSAERPLRPGDEVRVGRSRLLFRGESEPTGSHATERAEPPPPLTRREHDVLVALCRPVLAGDLFTEPASIREVATALGISEAAVKQHLLHLYDKFGVYTEPTRRRVSLANEAVRRGAVTLADLRTGTTGSR